MTNATLLFFAAETFHFDRLETALLTSSLAQVLADACSGAEEDERVTMPPKGSDR